MTTLGRDTVTVRQGFGVSTTSKDAVPSSNETGLRQRRKNYVLNVLRFITLLQQYAVCYYLGLNAFLFRH